LRTVWREAVASLLRYNPRLHWRNLVHARETSVSKVIVAVKTPRKHLRNKSKSLNSSSTNVESVRRRERKAARSALFSSVRPKRPDSRNKHFSILLHRKNDESCAGTYFIGLGFLM